MQQFSRSFHGAFRDMGTHDISTFQGTLIFQYFNKLQTSTSSRSFFATQADVSLALDLADSVGKKAWGADCPAQLAAAERPPPARRRVVANFWAKFRQDFARFRLYRHRSLQENTHFATFFKIYQMIKLKFLQFGKILQNSRHLQNFAEFSHKLLIFQTDFFLKF